jgi:hypothetical protein
VSSKVIALIECSDGGSRRCGRSGSSRLDPKVDKWTAGPTAKSDDQTVIIEGQSYMDPLRPPVDRHVGQQADRCFSIEGTSQCYRKDYGDGNRSMIKIRRSSALDVSHAPFHPRTEANLKQIRRCPGSVIRLDVSSSYNHANRTRCGKLSVGLRKPTV